MDNVKIMGVSALGGSAAENRDVRRRDREKRVKANWEQYLKGMTYKEHINLPKTVETNENFYIGKQWEGVSSNGLPTPVFNFLKRVVNFLTATVSSENIKMVCASMGETDENIAKAVSAAFEETFEENEAGGILRRFVKNAAVDGDGCVFCYWDSDIETGYPEKGGVRCELVENTRVIFGNSAERIVQKQPYIIVVSDEDTKSTAARARRFGSEDWERLESLTDERVRVILKLRKEGGTVWAEETTEFGVVREEWDLGINRYPLVWLSWDEVRSSYHGMGLVTGLIPNQIFVNKLFAMSMISLMTTAYPKIVFDKTRVEKWDSRVGAAIGVNGGDVSGVAKIIEPATISPQIGQFIDLAIGYTQNFMGATDAAMGNVRPDNTSAIIALQRASGIPIETVKQELYRAVEELGRIFMEYYANYYGKRTVKTAGGVEMFDFNRLRGAAVKLKLDVGVSNYWSEVASVQTIDNLLRSGQITLSEYLERIPDGYITGKEALLERSRAAVQTAV